MLMTEEDEDHEPGVVEDGHVSEPEAEKVSNPIYQRKQSPHH